MGCQEESASDGLFCFYCREKINYTDHFQVKNNDLLNRLSGRVDVAHAAALFRFIKGGIVQNAVHALKYRGRSDLGLTLGKRFGEHLLKSSLFQMPDYLVPVPVHRRREWHRGYNQSERFARGISEVTGSKVSERCLIKSKHLDSQTAKGRLDRFDNVLSSFELKNQNILEGKTVMIVDDVLTTGATIEAAYLLLRDIQDITIQIGLIALADG